MRLLIAFFAVGLLGGQNPPAVRNGRVETRPFSGELASQLQSVPATWFGYALKADHRFNQHCDGNYNNPVELEGSDTVAVLLRVENNRVQKLKMYSLACSLDAGGLPFVWLSGVTPQASLAYLKPLIDDGADGISNSALFLISQHAGEEATGILIDAAKNNRSTHAREQALFWLSQKAGARSAAAITDAILNDPNTEVKKKAVFALSQLPKDEGVPRLIEVAKTQRNPEVRKQAFFWLGQTHDSRAMAFIEDVLTK